MIVGRKIAPKMKVATRDRAIVAISLLSMQAAAQLSPYSPPCISGTVAVDVTPGGCESAAKHA